MFMMEKTFNLTYPIADWFLVTSRKIFSRLRPAEAWFFNGYDPQPPASI